MPTSTLTGDFSVFTRWTKKLDYVSSNRFATGFANKLADTLLDLIDEGFKSATDPDDHAWQKKAIPDGRSPLHGATGQLSQKKNWLKKQVDPRRIRIGPSPAIVARARFAQFGTGVYGPRGGRIVAQGAKALRWTGNGRVYFARSVSGSPIRRILPGTGKLPYKWLRALTIAKNAYINMAMRKAA